MQWYTVYSMFGVYELTYAWLYAEMQIVYETGQDIGKQVDNLVFNRIQPS